MATLEAPRSTPDLQKLAAMGSRTLNVTKLTSRSGAGLSIVTGKKNVSVEEITNLHTLLPTQPGAGPGTYKFEVFDETGPDKNEWTTRLGPDIQPEGSMGIDFGTAPGSLPPPGTTAPGGARHLGNGFWYDDSTGMLTTPTREVVSWKPGDEFPPRGRGVASAPAASTLPPWLQVPGAPGAWPGTGWGAGWGAMPATGGTEDETKRELRELRASMEAKTREDARDAAHRAEMVAIQRSVEETNKALAAAIAKLGEKPSGPSPIEATLAAQVEELKRQGADAAARADARQREDVIRAEIKANADRSEAMMREMKDALHNQKPDPMLTLLPSLLASQQAASSAALAAVSGATDAAAEASKESMRLMTERFGMSILTPERMEAMLKLAKDNGPNDLMNQGVLKMYQTLFGMSQDVLRQQAEIYNQAGGPAWVAPVQQGLETFGKIAQAYAQRKAEAETEAEIAAARAAKVEEARQRQEVNRVAQANADAQAAARRRAAAPAAPASPAAAAAAAGRPMTPDEEREMAARAVFKGADHVAGSGRNGASAAAAPAAAPAAAAPPPAGGRPRRRPAPPAAVPTTASPPPAAVAPDYIPPGGEEPPEADAGANVLTMHPRVESIVGVPSEALQGIIDAMDDAEFFGPFESQVKKLRSSAQTPEESANAVLASRTYFAAYGEELPAIELLQAGHIDLLCARLFPAAPQPYRAAVADAIRVQLTAESAEGAGATA